MLPRDRQRIVPPRAGALVAALLIVASTGSGCAVRGRLTPLEVATNHGDAQGRATSRFVFDPKNPALALPSDVQLFPPMPLGDNRLPDYPVAALSAGAAGFAGFRIVVGTDGRVGRIGPSPLIPEMEGGLARSFRASAEAAVATWRFEPAFLVRTEAGNDLDGDGEADFRRATSTEAVQVYLDVRFDFEIVNGRGSVRTAGASSP